MVQQSHLRRRQGRIFDDKDVSLWMRKGLIQLDNPAVNYITAISGKYFWIILMNEAQDVQTCNITFSDAVLVAANAEGLSYPGRTKAGRRVTLDAKGFAAIAFPLSGKQPARKIMPLKNGMQVVDLGPGIGISMHSGSVRPSDGIPCMDILNRYSRKALWYSLLLIIPNKSGMLIHTNGLIISGCERKCGF